MPLIRVLGTAMFDFDEDVPNDDWNKCGWGICVPILLLLLAFLRMAYRHDVPGGRAAQRLALSGKDAPWLALLLISIALLIHVRYFWTNTEKLAPFADLGKLVALLMFIGSLGMLLATHVVFL
ncbi:hypothetical protein [Schlesneria sp. DSM 10557]|uniref:hypothetical protein n=1 Tax=Schlesneria sp. DSM 10557 TaxID=3044399 RepID=UPI0035A1729E